MNSSFENHKSCPNAVSQFNHLVDNWSSPTFATPDYFHICSEKMGATNFNGNQKPLSGKGFAGIYAYASENYREYIHGEFIESLTKDVSYEISFHVSLAELSNHCIKEFGIQLSSKKMTGTRTENVINAKRISQRVPELSYQPFFSKEFYCDKEQWVKISVVYKAKGDEKFFIIGNFQDNHNTETQKSEKSKYEKFAYYYLDDISVEALKKEKTDTSNVQFKSDKIYIFKNVLFDFDKSELLDISKEELQKLYLHLNDNKHLSIEIYGHTDNVGTDKRNEELSKERAKAVSDYLINQGITSERIKWFGFGSSKPITSNETEEGRAQNRRVEYKLISE